MKHKITLIEKKMSDIESALKGVHTSKYEAEPFEERNHSDYSIERQHNAFKRGADPEAWKMVTLVQTMWISRYL